MFSTSLRTIDLTGSPCIANPSSTFVMCNRKNCEGFRLHCDKHCARAIAQQAHSRAKLRPFSAIAFAGFLAHYSSGRQQEINES
jgi:hypothetical protein